MIKAFDEWYGGWGCEDTPSKGYETFQNAEHIRAAVMSEMASTRGIQEIKVNIVDRYRDGRFWVRNVSTYDTDVKRNY